MAGSYLRDDLKKYKIEVPEGKQIIVRRRIVVHVPIMTTYRESLKILRSVIREEKEIFEKKLMENQEKLL